MKKLYIHGYGNKVIVIPLNKNLSSQILKTFKYTSYIEGNCCRSKTNLEFQYNFI